MSILDPSAERLGVHPRSSKAALVALAAILSRDLLVTRREIVSFLVQTLAQPLFFLFVFGKVLPAIGTAMPDSRRSCCQGSSLSRSS